MLFRSGLTLNEAKTSIKHARRERFDFLGYTFGPHRLRKDGHVYLGASPSKKSVSRLRQKVRDLLVRHNVAPWPEVRDCLNRILRGWSNYFGYGTRLMAYRAVDHYVHERVRHFLRHRHKVSSGRHQFLERDCVREVGGATAPRCSFGGHFRELVGEVCRKAGCSKWARPV